MFISIDTAWSFFVSMNNLSLLRTETNGSVFALPLNFEFYPMKKIIFAFFTAIAIFSCQHVSGTFVSTHGSRAGSSMQGNCIDCHKTGATEGGFIIGGSVFTTDGSTRNPNGTVYLHTLAPGAAGVDSIVATVEIDGVGNFYTTHSYDLSKGVYPSVTSSSGNKVFMTQSTTSGACNSCHGVSTAVITVN